MKELFMFLIMFLFIYLFYLIFVIRRKSVLKNFQNGKELRYLRAKYNLNYNKINIKKLANVVALANAFIFSSTISIMSLVGNIILEVLLGITTLVLLMIIIYHFIGIYFKKQEEVNKNV